MSERAASILTKLGAVSRLGALALVSLIGVASTDIRAQSQGPSVPSKSEAQTGQKQQENEPPSGEEKDEAQKQDPVEPEEQNFFNRLMGGLADDMAATAGLISWTPRLNSESGNATSDGPGDYDGGEWFGVPIPQSSPTLGTGLAGGAGYIYRVNPDDELSPPTITGLGGLFTSNDSWGVGGTHRMAWSEDRFRFNFTAAYGDINYLFKPTELNLDYSIPINLKGTFIETDFKYRVFERVFVGPRFTFLDSEATPFPDYEGEGGGEEPPSDTFLDYAIDSTVISLGFEVMRDTRDSLFYPRSGSLGTFRAGFFDEGLGSDFNYQKYDVTYNFYWGLGQNHVIAATATGCSVQGDAPFFELCYLGQEENLRGYRVGFHQGRFLVSTQAEYRLHLFWRFGVVGFAGVGQVAQDLGAFDKDNWLPGIGFGIRILVAKENRVNLRIDFAWGRGSSATYVGGGEAF